MTVRSNDIQQGPAGRVLLVRQNVAEKVESVRITHRQDGSLPNPADFKFYLLVETIIPPTPAVPPMPPVPPATIGTPGTPGIPGRTVRTFEELRAGHALSVANPIELLDNPAQISNDIRSVLRFKIAGVTEGELLVLRVASLVEQPYAASNPDLPDLERFLDNVLFRIRQLEEDMKRTPRLVDVAGAEIRPRGGLLYPSEGVIGYQEIVVDEVTGQTALQLAMREYVGADVLGDITSARAAAETARVAAENSRIAADLSNQEAQQALRDTTAIVAGIDQREADAIAAIDAEEADSVADADAAIQVRENQAVNAVTAAEAQLRQDLQNIAAGANTAVRVKQLMTRTRAASTTVDLRYRGITTPLVAVQGSLIFEDIPGTANRFKVLINGFLYITFECCFEDSFSTATPKTTHYGVAHPDVVPLPARADRPPTAPRIILHRSVGNPPVALTPEELTRDETAPHGIFRVFIGREFVVDDEIEIVVDSGLQEWGLVVDAVAFSAPPNPNPNPNPTTNVPGIPPSAQDVTDKKIPVAASVGGVEGFTYFNAVDKVTEELGESDWRREVFLYGRSDICFERNATDRDDLNGLTYVPASNTGNTNVANDRHTFAFSPKFEIGGFVDNIEISLIENAFLTMRYINGNRFTETRIEIWSPSSDFISAVHHLNVGHTNQAGVFNNQAYTVGVASRTVFSLELDFAVNDTGDSLHRLVLVREDPLRTAGIIDTDQTILGTIPLGDVISATVPPNSPNLDSIPITSDELCLRIDLQNASNRSIRYNAIVAGLNFHDRRRGLAPNTSEYGKIPVAAERRGFPGFIYNDPHELTFDSVQMIDHAVPNTPAPSDPTGNNKSLVVRGSALSIRDSGGQETAITGSGGGVAQPAIKVTREYDTLGPTDTPTAPSTGNDSLFIRQDLGRPPELAIVDHNGNTYTVNDAGPEDPTARYSYAMVQESVAYRQSRRPTGGLSITSASTGTVRFSATNSDATRLWFRGFAGNANVLNSTRLVNSNINGTIPSAVITRAKAIIANNAITLSLNSPGLSADPLVGEPDHVYGDGIVGEIRFPTGGLPAAAFNVSQEDIYFAGDSGNILLGRISTSAGTLEVLDQYTLSTTLGTKSHNTMLRAIPTVTIFIQQNGTFYFAPGNPWYSDGTPPNNSFQVGAAWWDGQEWRTQNTLNTWTIRQMVKVGVARINWTDNDVIAIGTDNYHIDYKTENTARPRIRQINATTSFIEAFPFSLGIGSRVIRVPRMAWPTTGTTANTMYYLYVTIDANGKVEPSINTRRPRFMPGVGYYDPISLNLARCVGKVWRDANTFDPANGRNAYIYQQFNPGEEIDTEFIYDVAAGANTVTVRKGPDSFVTAARSGGDSQDIAHTFATGFFSSPPALKSAQGTIGVTAFLTATNTTVAAITFTAWLGAGGSFSSGTATVGRTNSAVDFVWNRAGNDFKQVKLWNSLR